MRRSTSSKAIPESMNPNVSWMSSPMTWPFYIISVLVFRLGIAYFVPPAILSAKAAWTLTSIVHGIISFVGLHWNRGTPFWDTSYDEETVWEQIDAGVPWTPTRKFLMIVPIALFVLTCMYTEYDAAHLVVNGIVVAVLIIAKLPEMHKVRLFGVNKLES